MALQFLPEEDQPSAPVAATNNGHDLAITAEPGAKAAALQSREQDVYVRQADAPPCHECGSIMIRNGACYACVNCGATSGCS
jgi:ribonucleoside-diphosphate reductase alpha chain